MQTFFESPLSSVLSRDYLNPKSVDKHYQSFTLRNFRQISQISRLSAEQIDAIEVVGRVFPFLDENNIFQILNEEFISSLAKFLIKLNGFYKDKSPIVEIGAGNGKLSYHLKKNGVNIIPTDNHSWKIKTGIAVENLGHMWALKKYNPSRT